MDRGGAVARERTLVVRGGIAAVRLEAVRRVVLCLLGHHRVARGLGDDRRGRDRQHLLVAFDDRAHDTRHREIVVVAVEHDAVRGESLRGELFERATRGPALRLGHADEIALFVRRVTHTDAPCPAPHPGGRDLAFVVRQQLRVAHAREVLVAGDDGRDGHRTGPRPPSDLVDTHYHAVARGPALPLDSQRRIRGDHSA